MPGIRGIGRIGSVVRILPNPTNPTNRSYQSYQYRDSKSYQSSQSYQYRDSHHSCDAAVSRVGEVPRSFEIFAGLGLTAHSLAHHGLPPAGFAERLASKQEYLRASFARPHIFDDAVSAPYDACAAEIRANPRRHRSNL